MRFFSIRSFIAAISLLALPAMGVLPMPAKQVSVVTNGWENIVPEGGSNDAQNALGWIDTNWQKVNSNSWAILAGADTNTVQAVFDYLDYLLNITNGGFGTIVVANSNVTPQIVFDWLDDNMALATNLTLLSNHIDSVSSTNKSETNRLLAASDILIRPWFRNQTDITEIGAYTISSLSPTSVNLSTVTFASNPVSVSTWGYLRSTNRVRSLRSYVDVYISTNSAGNWSQLFQDSATYDGAIITDNSDHGEWSFQVPIPTGYWYLVQWSRGGMTNETSIVLDPFTVKRLE